MATRLATATRNAMATAIATLVDADAGAGTIKLYTGAQPATANTAASGTLIATVVLADPAFGAVSNGVIAATDPAPVNPVASGTVGWFRLTDASGDTVLDGSVTATGGGGDIELSNVALGPGINVDITSYTITIPAG